MLEHGAYTLLMDACYDREEFPTKEQAIEWCFARTDEEERAVEFVLKRFFSINDDGVYVQSRIMEELLNYQENAQKNKEIAIERERKKRLRKKGQKHEACTVRERTEHERAPNQEPLTTNHEPETNKPTIEDAKASLSEQGVPPCPHQDIISLYNKTLPELQQVIPERWSGARAKALQARWRESKKHQSLQFWERFFKKLREFPFYLGDNDRDWRADLGWLVKRKNFDNLVEKFISGTNK